MPILDFSGFRSAQVEKNIDVENCYSVTSEY